VLVVAVEWFGWRRKEERKKEDRMWQPWSLSALQCETRLENKREFERMRNKLTGDGKES